MEILGELLLFVLQVILEVFGEALLEVGLAGLKEAFGRENRDPYLAAVGYFILGVAVGGLSLLLWPQRILRAGRVPGFSLVLGPVAAGGAMEAWGRFRKSRGHDPTNLATFLGGAAFALGWAVIRFWWVR